MINPLYTWSLKHGEFCYVTTPKKRVAHAVLHTVFRTRYALEKAKRVITFHEREARRYRKKLDNLYAIFAEYEAFGDAATDEMDDSRIDAILAREAVAYGE